MADLTPIEFELCLFLTARAGPGMADLTPIEFELCLFLTGFLRGLSACSPERFDFDEHERAMLRQASMFTARLVGRPDLAPPTRDELARREEANRG